MSEIIGQENQYSPPEEYNVTINQPFLKNLAGWATFKAIIEIIVGVLSCLSFILIIPAVYGVFQIISGVKLLNAVDELKRYMGTNDSKKIVDTFYNLHKYFKLSGISTIIQICFIFIAIIAYIVLIIYFINNAQNLPDIFRDLNQFNSL